MAVKPKRLKIGDTIGLIAPSSGSKTPSMITKGIKILHQMGFKTLEGEHIRKRWNYLSAPDKDRVSDIMRMYENPKVDAIMCIRGGYGTGRLFAKLDYDVIKSNPKILTGFSDITGLSLAIQKKCNHVTFHGPMLTSNLAQPDMHPHTKEFFFNMVMNPTASGSIIPGSDKKNGIIINKGKASGMLTGGNLSIVNTTIGTPWEITTKGKIVFLEDVGEDLYRIDRMLTHLLNAGKLTDAAGIALGQFTYSEGGKNYRKLLQDVIKDLLGWIKLPVVMDLPFGHVKCHSTIPYGITATLDANTTGDLIIDESAVK